MNVERSMMICLVVIAALVSGCVTQQKRPAPLSYVAITRPSSPIKSAPHVVDFETKRGGMYVLNKNFRPAPDTGAYLEQAQRQSNTEVLRNADVELRVPVVIDILLFGFQIGKDKTTACN